MTSRTSLLGKAVGGALLASLLVVGGAAMAQDKQVTIGQLQFNPNLHPLIQVNNTKRTPLGLVLRPVTAFDDKGTNVCRLCAEVPSLENGLAKMVDRPDGKKGMEVTIKLRPGLSWGDGVKVTAKDIAFTWEVARDPKIGFSNYNPWTRADRVDVKDDQTAVLHLPAYDAGYASWDHIIPEHLERAVYEKSANLEDYIKQTTYNQSPTNPGLWNGPFMFTDYRPGTIVVASRNPHWPGPGPSLDKVVLSYRDNNSALVQNLLAGAVDAVPVSPGGISFAQMLDVRKQHKDRFTFQVHPGDNLERIAFNVDNPALADVNIRRAIAHGIDRQAIVEALFEGLQIIAHGPLTPSNPFYSDADLAKYPFDQKKARDLIAQAGWKPGADGICQNAKGDRLSFELGSTSGNKTREQIAQVIQSQLKEVCIETVGKFVPLREYNGELARKRKFTGMIMSSIDFPPSASPGIVFGSDQVPSEANTFVGNNFSGYKSSAMDAAVQKVDSSQTMAGQRDGWKAVQKQFSQDLPFLPLYFYAQSYVTVPGLKDFPAGSMDPVTNWAEAWRKE